jgi:hypothetical protein
MARAMLACPVPVGKPEMPDGFGNLNGKAIDAQGAP